MVLTPQYGRKPTHHPTFIVWEYSADGVTQDYLGRVDCLIRTVRRCSQDTAAYHWAVARVLTEESQAKWAAAVQATPTPRVVPELSLNFSAGGDGFDCGLVLVPLHMVKRVAYVVGMLDGTKAVNSTVTEKEVMTTPSREKHVSISPPSQQLAADMLAAKLPPGFHAGETYTRVKGPPSLYYASASPLLYIHHGPLGPPSH